MGKELFNFYELNNDFIEEISYLRLACGLCVVGTLDLDVIILMNIMERVLTNIHCWEICFSKLSFVLFVPWIAFIATMNR